MTIKERIQISATILDRNSIWIGQSDAKAVAVLAFEAGLLALLSPKFSEIKSILTTNQSLQFTQYALFFVTVLFTFFLAKAGYFSLVALVPKVKPTNFSHIFFGNIAQLDEVQMIADFEQLTDEDLLSETLSQVWATSSIAVQKYGAVKEAILSLGLSLVFWVTILLITL